MNKSIYYAIGVIIAGLLGYMGYSHFSSSEEVVVPTEQAQYAGSNEIAKG